MISAEREQELRKLIRAAQHNGNWEYVIDFEDVTDLLALCDEQKERIAALEKERTLVRADLIQIKEDCQDFVSDKMLRENVLNLVCAALARVTQEKS